MYSPLRFQCDGNTHTIVLSSSGQLFFSHHNVTAEEVLIQNFGGARLACMTWLEKWRGTSYPFLPEDWRPYYDAQQQKHRLRLARWQHHPTRQDSYEDVPAALRDDFLATLLLQRALFRWGSPDILGFRHRVPQFPWPFAFQPCWHVKAMRTSALVRHEGFVHTDPSPVSRGRCAALQLLVGDDFVHLHRRRPALLDGRLVLGSHLCHWNSWTYWVLDWKPVTSKGDPQLHYVVRESRRTRISPELYAAGMAQGVTDDT